MAVTIAEKGTCRGPDRILYTRLPLVMLMPLQIAYPTMAPMESSPAAAISIEGMTASRLQPLVST